MILFFVTLFFCISGAAFAGSFKAVPVRLYLDAQSKTAVLKIVNEGDEKVTVQMDAKSWKQDDAGKDIYDSTGDIIIFPKLASIEKGVTRIIRVGYKGKPGLQEKTYRLFAQELPVTKPGELALKFALTLSIPVFVAPEKEMANWTAEAAGLSEESLKVKVTNSGNSHIIVSKIKARGLNESGEEVFSRETAGWYTLAGKSRIYTVGIPHEECLKARTIKVEATIERTTREFSFEVKKEMCTVKPEAPTEATKTRPAAVGPKDIQKPDHTK